MRSNAQVMIPLKRKAMLFLPKQHTTGRQGGRQAAASKSSVRNDIFLEDIDRVDSLSSHESEKWRDLDFNLDAGAWLSTGSSLAHVVTKQNDFPKTARILYVNQSR